VPDPAPEGDRASGLSSGARHLAPRALAVAIALAGLVYVLGLAPGGGSFSYGGPEAPAFEISWDELEEVTPLADELLRLERLEDGELLQRLTVAPLPGTVEPVEGDGALTRVALLADDAREAIAREHPGARVALEGLGRLEIRGGLDAYQIAFRAPAEGGGLLLGKLLLVPEDADDSARGVAIEILERTTDDAVIERATRAPATFFFNWPSPALLEDEAAVQTERGLEEPLRSFEFR
jgi:hypothetical protein